MNEKMFDIIIMVDENDADYITEVSEITEDDLEKIKPLIEAIKNFKPYKVVDNSGLSWTHKHNFPYDPYDSGYTLREDLGEKPIEELYSGFEEALEIFKEHMPMGENGIHTISSVEVCPVRPKTKLL